MFLTHTDIDNYQSLLFSVDYFIQCHVTVTCDHINRIRNMIYMFTCLILSDTSDLSKMSKSNTVILMFIDLTCQPIDCGGWQ